MTAQRELRMITEKEKEAKEEPVIDDVEEEGRTSIPLGMIEFQFFLHFAKKKIV